LTYEVVDWSLIIFYSTPLISILTIS
jgi:hypothetical protein